jgi:hypothetical protein
MGSSVEIPAEEADYFTRFTGSDISGSPEVHNGHPFRGPEADIWFTIIF